MKKYSYIAVILFVGVSVSGCMNRQGEVDYASSGVLAGAAAGSVMGGAVSHSPEGAIVGAAVGAVTGGIVGEGMEQKKETENYEQEVQSAPLFLDELKELVAAGISDDVIISQIHASGTVYYLTSNDIIDLKKSGVSEKIIDYLINTPYTADGSADSGRTVSQVYQADPVIITPYPHYIWIGGSWMWFDGHSGMRPGSVPRFPGPEGHMH